MSVADRATLGTAVRVASVLLVVLCTAAAARVSVPLPLTPVPFTLQPMFVLVSGAALGSRLGMTSQLLYLMAGMAGLPVFAASGILPMGLVRLLGPTGGYLMAYPFAAFLTGALAERGFDRRYWTSLLAMGAGLVVIFAGGLAWLGFVTPGPADVDRVLSLGLYPFIVLDLVKLAAAAAVLPGLWRLVGPRPSLRS